MYTGYGICKVEVVSLWPFYFGELSLYDQI